MTQPCLFRTALLPVMIMALLLRVLIPVGFMPSFDDGKVALIICHGAETQTIWVDADQAPPGTTQKASGEICPFMALGMMSPHASGFCPLAFLLNSFLVLLLFTAIPVDRMRRLVQIAVPRAPPAYL